MKKIFLYLLIIGIPLLSLPSCIDDFLDTEAESSLTSEVIFADPTLAESAVMGIYEQFQANSFNGRLWPYKGLNNDTEMHLASFGGLTESNTHRSIAVYNNKDGDDFMGPATSIAFSAIERANLCIEGLELYGNPAPGNKLGYLLGEALFLRAWVYFELVNWYGNIPARFVPLNSENLYVGRSDRDVIFKQLLVDLERAAELMPWAGTSPETKTILRPNKAAAKAFRARIALFAGGYGYHTYGEMNVAQLSDDPDLTVEKTYTIARDECWDIMENEGKGFILESEFEKIFKDNCQVKVEAGSEPLFNLPFNYNKRGNWMVAAGVIHAGAAGSGNPASGSDPYTSVYQGGTHGTVPTLFYDFEKADKRRDVSVVPFRWANGKQELATVRRMTPGKLRAEWIDLSKGMLSTNSNDGITPIIIRYADVLLMFAEAENQLNGATDRAKNALNRVRTRGYGGLSQKAYVDSKSGSKADFLKAIQDERRLEFVGETIRKYDLIRWNLLKTNMDKVIDDTRALRSFTGKYADVPGYVFWKYKTDKAGEREIIYYGFNRGEVAPGTSGDLITDEAALNLWMSTNGWKHWNTKGNASATLTVTPWIDSRTDTGELRDEYVTCLYLNNPDRQLVCPLPRTIITNSQGSLSNSDLGY
ncbi:RagB/SusD family nutrient uptake outer membrane protein [Dysgonomonas sp. 511]|uniref:RagB/SusD family nutrient uptake outer membrane protein n=1 Tax=Dysgonomonas sp. 511 TaxID=2302930 RepID=UPI0013D56FAA|nr:RagB/SusD family nutrient uptake outer membrane protein [Dysgonomonas sp. 511]NDV78204.1 RagB/SusD family nutrient uptake outer membrane protein [Dysgonomonas sp. 511]